MNNVYNNGTITPMALNLKNEEVESLARELSQVTGESKTEAVRKALLERKSRLAFKINTKARSERIRQLLDDEIWPAVPEGAIGKKLTREQEEEILGFNEFGA